MSNTRFNMVRGQVLRATRLNHCGVRVPGPNSRAVTDGFISVGLTMNMQERETVEIPDYTGQPVVLDKPPPAFLDYSVTISLCGVDPMLFTLLTGQPIVIDAHGNATGFRQNSRIRVDLSGFALEMWTKIAGGCDQDGNQTYGYTLLPYIRGGVLGDLTVENAALNFSLSGANTSDGSGWGVGDLPVLRDASGTPSRLATPIDLGDHLNLELTTLAPPEQGTYPVSPPPTGDIVEDPPGSGLYTTGSQAEDPNDPGLYSTDGLTEDPTEPGMYIIPT